MSSVLEQAVREPDVSSAPHYARRVRLLALAYTGLFLFSLVGIGLIIWRAQFFVTLSQRSNVETLTLAFLIIFFAYLASLSAPGMRGALTVLYFAALARLGRDPLALERRKMRALGPPGETHAVVALNMALEREDDPEQPVRLQVADAAGSLGYVEICGVEMRHHPTIKHGSTSLLAYGVAQINDVLRARGAPAGLDIVEWHGVDDESAQEYVNLVRFVRNLERHLGAHDLWPARAVNAADRMELERRFAAVCVSLRDEAFMPRWEYAGEHRIPLIPEPLGLISLSRSERRVDQLASMGCAVSIVIVVVAILVLFIFFPPWVPGV